MMQTAAVQGQDPTGPTVSPFLAPEYADIVRNSERIEREHKRKKEALRSLYGVVLDLYVDVGKLRGSKEAARRRVPKLQQVCVPSPTFVT